MKRTPSKRKVSARSRKSHTVTISGIELPYVAGQSLSVAIVNPLGWARGGVVRLPDKGLPRAFELVDPRTGERVPCERHDGALEILAPVVPAFGYLALQVRPVHRGATARCECEWQERTLSLNRNDCTLQFHEAGGLARWHDRMRSCQWCSDAVEFPLGSVLCDVGCGPASERIAGVACPSSGSPERRHGGAALGHATRSLAGVACPSPRTRGRRHVAREVRVFVNGKLTGTTILSPGRCSAAAKGNFARAGDPGTQIATAFSPLAARVVVESACPTRGVGASLRYRTEYTLYAGRRELHVRTRLLGDLAAVRGAYANMPLASEDPRVFLNRTGDSVEVRKPTSAGATMPLRGMRLQSTHAGMNLYPLHTPLISLGRPGQYAFPPKGCKDGIVYATLLDNARESDRQYLVGPASCRSVDRLEAGPTKNQARWDFILHPTGNDAADGGLATGSAEYHRPLRAAVVKGALESSGESLLKADQAGAEIVTYQRSGRRPLVCLLSPAEARFAIVAG